MTNLSFEITMKLMNNDHKAIIDTHLQSLTKTPTSTTFHRLSTLLEYSLGYNKYFCTCWKQVANRVHVSHCQAIKMFCLFLQKALKFEYWNLLKIPQWVSYNAEGVVQLKVEKLTTPSVKKLSAVWILLNEHPRLFFVVMYMVDVRHFFHTEIPDDAHQQNLNLKEIFV